MLSAGYNLGVLKALVVYAFRRLRARKLTTILTMLGIAIGVANIVALISVSESARAQALRLLNELGANTVFVTPYFELEEGFFDNQSSTAATFLPLSDYELIKDRPYVETATPILALPAFVAHKDRRKFTTVIGTNEVMQKIRPYRNAEGRMFTADDVAQGASVMVLGYEIAKRLFPEGGAVGKKVVLKGEYFTIVGTFEEKGHIGFESFDDRVFTPLSTAQRIFDFPYIHVVAIRHPDNLDSEEVVAAAKRDLAEAKGVELEVQDEFQVFSMKEITRTMQGTFRIFAVVMLSVSSVALIVAGILIMTVMLMSVMEQTREIGVRRAVGARRRDILVQFLTETLLQVFGGQVLGFILGIIGVWIVCARADWPFYLTWHTVLTAFLFSLGVGILFGLLPAYRAATLDPVDSLRYE